MSYSYIELLYSKLREPLLRDILVSIFGHSKVSFILVLLEKQK